MTERSSLPPQGIHVVRTVGRFLLTCVFTGVAVWSAFGGDWDAVWVTAFLAFTAMLLGIVHLRRMRAALRAADAYAAENRGRLDWQGDPLHPGDR